MPPPLEPADRGHGQPPPSDALRARRDALGEELARLLAADGVPLARLQDLRERLDLLDRVLATRRTPPRPRRWKALWPVALVAVVLAVSALVPVRTVPLSLQVKAGAATLVLPHAGVLGPLEAAGDVRIEGFTEADSAHAALRQALHTDTSGGATVRGEELMLRSLSWPAGSRLHLQARREATLVQVESTRSPIVAELQVRGGAALRGDDAASAATVQLAQGEWLRFASRSGGDGTAVPQPLGLSLPRRGDAAPRITGLRPQALRFAQPGDSGRAVADIVSSLEEGTLVMPATQETLALMAGDGLEIDGLVVNRLDVAAGFPLVLSMSGSARGLRLRTGEFERSLKPSVLEYVARHHLVNLLWGGAAVLWGALAWARSQWRAVEPEGSP